MYGKPITTKEQAIGAVKLMFEMGTLGQQGKLATVGEIIDFLDKKVDELKVIIER